MAVVTENRDLTWIVEPTQTISLPVEAGTRLFKGSFIGVNYATRYAKAFTVGDELIGVAAAEADNSDGLAGALNVGVYIDGVVNLELSAAAVTDGGLAVYATDSGAVAKSGHALGFFGRITNKVETTRVGVALKAPGELPRKGEKGSLWVEAQGPPATTTGAASAALYGDGLTYSGTLGLGVAHESTNGAHAWTLQLDATSEVSNAQIITPAMFDGALGIVAECELSVVSASDNTVDVEFGIADAVVVTDVDPARHARFHYDGGSENLLAGSDDNTADIAETDTTIDNVSGTTKKLVVILRPSGPPEFYIAGSRVLSTTFDTVVLMNALATAYICYLNVEKTTGAATAEVRCTRFACYGAGVA